MVLSGKNAIIFGGGGSMGGAVARALAAEGATVLLAGPHATSLQQVADDIGQSGGRAEIRETDALDESSVAACIQDFMQRHTTLDIVFNAVETQDTQGIPLTDMKVADFVRPVTVAMQTQFLTSTLAARVMMQQHSGVILSLTATPGGVGYPLVGGFGPACCAVESFTRDLGSELGPHGIRVVNIRSAGSPDSRPFRQALEENGDFAGDFIRKLKDDTMLKRLPMMADIAGVAVFLASAQAACITGVTIDVTCGTTSALNYKVQEIGFVQEQR